MGSLLVGDRGDTCLGRDYAQLAKFSSRLVMDRFMESSDPRGESGRLSTDGETLWLLRNGRKMDSSISRWIRVTAELRVSGRGGVVMLMYRRRTSRASLDRLISWRAPGKM
jgi:hypothetical protein